jgi:aminoglycoside phosphotransferase (APT) family kinase protein
VARFDRQLADLTTAGVVSSRQGRRLLARVQAGLPARAERGVTHGDLRPENLIVAPSGDLVSVDNEAVAFDFLDHDLGRTWCRWPMSSAAWSQFFRRYESWGRPGPGADLESTWRCVAAVKGAHRWHRAVRATTDAPLVALSRVLDDL